jgi:alpha-2-macroglobulin
MNNYRWIPLLAALVIATSCTADRDTLKVTSELPSGVVPRTGVIELTFSRAVAPPDLQNTWSSEPYIEFSPAIPGKFVWQDSVRLVFSPDAQLPGDARFTGKLNTGLLTKMSGAVSFSGESEFEFATERFTLKSAEFFYDRVGEGRAVGIKANLEFTYLVNPEDVARQLRVQLDREPWKDLRVVSTAAGRVIAVELGSVQKLDRSRTVELSFGDGLTSPETGTSLVLEKPFSASIAPLDELKVLGHSFAFDGKESAIRLSLSQEVDPRTAKDYIAIEPGRPFTVEADGRSLTIKGKFEPGTAFRLAVKKNLESALGGHLQNDYEADVVFGNIPPTFSFGSASGSYLMLSGARAVEVKTVNLDSLSVRVSQIFQNNLVHFLDQGRSYDYEYYEGDEGWEYSRKLRYNVGTFGRLLNQSTLPVVNRQNQEVSTLVDLSRYLQKDFKGFLLLDIADPKEQWRTTSKLVSVSDLGIIVKRSTHEVAVFVVNLETNEPVSSAQVTLVSTNNQSMATKQTDGSGAATFDTNGQEEKGFYLKLVIVEKGGDYNFLNLADYQVETSRYDVGGKYDWGTNADAFLYGDRNIYRPGEPIIVSGIVRDLTGANTAGRPVRLKLFNPRGSAIAEFQRTLNQGGSFEITQPTLPSAMTGEYRFDLSAGNDAFIASYRVMVEDFVPDRLKVNLRSSLETARPGETIEYTFQALNFFGPPAAGRDWEFEGSFDHTPFRSKTFSDFRFSDDGAKDYTGDPVIFNGRTDGEGNGSVEFQIPQGVTSTGLLRARGRIAVFDESGRPVYQLAQTTVFPKNYFIGIRQRGETYVSPNTPQKVDLIAVDPADKPIKNFTAKVELIRLEWHSVLRQHGPSNTLRYVSEKREISVRSDQVMLGSEPLSYTYSVPRSGEYVLRVSKEGDSGYNQISFYSYSWATTDVTSFQVDPEARVEIVLDKKVYSPGDRAKVLFQTPFDGTMLVTVERNSVFSHRYVKVANNAASIDLDIGEELLPNAYISAVLFRKIKDQQIPLLAGHGFVPLLVEKKSNKIELTINAPERIRPKTKQKVTVEAPGEDNVFVTLAAVDEGICQLRNYATPDPYGYFYAKRALQTSTHDFFKDLLPEFKIGKQSSPGGGEDAEMAKRTNPLGVQRFKPVALWSGILSTGSRGSTEVTLDVPEFSGELRLMAVAYKGSRYGSSQKAMKVSDPVVITPGLPRFLAPNDQITMTITAFNTTDKPAELTFSVETTGGLTATPARPTLAVGPNQERTVELTLSAGAAVGMASVVVKTEAFGERIESKTELSVRPVSPFVTETVVGSLEGGKTATHDIADSFLPAGRRSYLSLSVYPVANFAKPLKSLVGYPHGCVEQTTSKAFPQIYLRDIAVMLDPSILERGSPTYFVNEAITKLSSMQMADGSFAYWPGGTESNPWSTVYATHFLVEAKKAGYAVSDNILNGALNAVLSIARSKKTTDYASERNNRVVVRRIADKSVPYGLYVLALAGKPEPSLMNFYRREQSLLTTDTRALLAGAFALSGERTTYVELMPKEFEIEEAKRTSGECFDSPIRANALVLNILLETDPSNPSVARYLRYLSGAYANTWWYSTQDNAFTLLAFGKAARQAVAAKLTATIRAGDKEFTYKGGTERFGLEAFGKSVSIAAKGEGRLYYSIVSEGIRKDGAVRLEDKNLQIRREYFTRSGQPVDLSAVRRNDLMVVKLTLSSSVAQLENVAVADLLPAGFEIENPRITETTRYAFIRNAATAEYLDVRDDRLLLYTSFRGGNRQQVFYYMVRAVTQGRFQLPAVVAEAMYDGEYYSASGAGTVVIGR